MFLKDMFSKFLNTFLIYRFILNVDWKDDIGIGQSYKRCEALKNHIAQTEGVKQASFNKSNYSNIIAIAEWKKSDAKKWIKHIREMDDVKRVEARIES